MADQTTSDIEARLRQMGVDADARNDEAQEQEVASPEPEKPAEPTVKPADEVQPSADKPDSSGTEPEKKEEAPKEEELSPYEKAKREKKDREAKAWQKIEEEKAANKAERERIESERKTFEETTRKAQVERDLSQPLRDQHGYSADDYERAAKQFAADGSTDLAGKAAAQAQQLRGQQAQQQQNALQSKWHDCVTQTCEAEPTLKDPSTPLGQRVKALLQSDPMYSQVPDGFKRAVSVAKAEMAAGSVPELQTKLQQLEKENERLKSLSTLPGSNPGAPPKEKSLDSLPMDQRMKKLRAMAAAADLE